MITMERKVDLIMRYIATDDEELKSEMKNVISELIKLEPTTVNPTPDADDLIADLLKRIGMPPHLVGYNYAATAIKLCMDDPEFLRNITSWLYPTIAKKYNTTPSRVERAIRHATEVCFDRGDIDTIVAVFGNTMSTMKGKLTNSEFIAASANEISRQMKKLSA